MDLNKVMIIGRLTRDPEVRTTPNGVSVASFSAATNLVWTDSSGEKQEKTEFHNIVVWRKLADICGQYLKKGSKAYFEGRLETRDWEGQDGVKRYRTEIVVDNMIMLDSARGGDGGSSPVPQQSQESAETNLPQMDGQKDASSEEEIKVENIPF